MQFAAFALLGVNAENGKRLLVSLGIVAAVIAARYAIVGIVRLVTGEKPNERLVFWTRQGASLATAVLACAALGSLWFENSSRLATVVGFVGAGLAFALQKVVAFIGARGGYRRISTSGVSRPAAILPSSVLLTSHF